MDFAWAAIFLLGCEALSLPLRMALAGGTADGAVRRVLSRLAGPAAFCLPLWIAGRFFPVALTAWFFWAVCAAVAGAVGYRSYRNHGKYGSDGGERFGPAAGTFAGRALGYEQGQTWFGRFGLELVSVALFFGYVALRRYSPDMTAYPINSSGAEKFTNAMLFWSSWHAGALPPEDSWLAGQPLVYYYWGHFFWAWVGRMIGAPGGLVINLALARLALMVFESTWLLGRAVKLPAGWATAAALAAAWGGNIAALPSAWHAVHDAWPTVLWGSYSYWDARSVMPGTVNEFPAFTAILGDFHSHHMALPWLIGWLALIVGARRWSRPAGATAAAWVAMGAGAALANMWNLPPMAWAIGLGAVCFAWERWRGPTQANTQRQQNPGRPETEGQRSDDDGGRNAQVSAWVALGAVAGFGIVIGIGMAMMRGGQGLPLSTSGEGGVFARIPLRIVPGAIRSTFAQLMKVWGLPVITLGLAAVGRAFAERRWHLTMFIVSVVPCAMALQSGPLLWFAVLVWAVMLSLPPGRSALSPQAAALLLGVLAVAIGLEIFYIDDFYSGQYERYNTYFKFSYPLWPALIVAAAAGARTLWNASLGAVRWGGRVCLAAIALAAAVYPIFAFPARSIQARASDAVPMPPTLDAVDFLKYQRAPYSLEAPLMDWIRENVPVGGRVAEAPALEPYTYGGRVACLAGRPIPLGWSHHEVQWRGPGAMAMINDRTESIDRLYRARTPAETIRAARKLKTRWVLWGIEEERRYGRGADAILREAGRVAIANAPFAVIDLGEGVLEERR